MNLDYLLMRSEWAIDRSEGLRYLMQAYSEFEYLGSEFKNTMDDRKRENSTITVVSGSGTQLFENVEALSGVDGIAVVQLSGAMLLEDGLCSTGMKSFSRTLRALDSMSNIKGILLEVNSGGGESHAGQLVYSTVKDLKTKTGALVHTAGSAAYMGIAPANFIMSVGELSKVGGIGALTSINKGDLAYIKENYTDIYSDLSPQKNIEIRELMEGLDTGVKKQINEVAQSFQNMVMNERALTYKKADTLEGRMFGAKEAKKRGLIDYVGSFDQAIKQMSKLINK